MTTTTATLLPASSGVSPKIVERAVNALLKWRAEKSKTQKPQLLEQNEFVYLVLTLKKIPQKDITHINAHKIPLLNPIIDPEADSSELCLIIDDRSKSGLTKDAVKKKIQNDNVPISKIIKISKLKTDYRPFEAKRKLCDSYDMFFADKRVVHLLPKMLGKQFFRKRKIPVPVDLKHKNWKEQVDKACGSALLYLRTGTCSVVKVGKTSMGREEIVKNVVAAINGIAEFVPRKWGGIRSLHLKLLESLALPIYQALPDFRLKIESGRHEEEEEEERKVNDDTAMQESEGEKVGNKKKEKKGRIHEVRYMDENVNGSEIVSEGQLKIDGAGDINGDEDAEMVSGDLEAGEKRVELAKVKKDDITGKRSVTTKMQKKMKKSEVETMMDKKKKKMKNNNNKESSAAK